MKVCDAATAERYRAEGWWPDATFDDYLFRHMRERAQQEAIVDPPNRSEIDGLPPARLTWTDFGEAVARMAAALANAGVGVDDVLVAQMANTWELIALYFAAARLGAIVSPVPTQYREHELGHVATHARASAFVITPRIGRHDHGTMVSALAKDLRLTLFSIGEAPSPAIDLAAAAAMERSNIDQAMVATAQADDIVCLCWTSGSESRPKAVARSHSQWIAVSALMIEAANLRPGCRILNGRPVVTVGAMTATLSPWLVLGGTLVNHHPFTLDVFLKQILDERINFTGCAPAVLVRLAEHPAVATRSDLGALRSISSGSAALPAHLIKQYRDRLGVEIINVFGSTEGTLLASTPRDIPDPDVRATYFPRYRGDDRWHLSMARGIESRLLDPKSGAVIDVPGQAGELCHRGPFTFCGYFNATEQTNATFDSDSFARTGDLFEIAGDDQQYYRFVGRLKDIVVRGGMNISAVEVETLVALHPAIAEAAAIGVPDAVFGERVAVAVVFRPGKTATLAEINAFLRNECRLAVFKQPERLLALDAIPRTAVGKVDKVALRTLAAEAAAAPALTSADA